MKIRKFQDKNAEACYDVILSCIKDRKNLSEKSKNKILSGSKPKRLIEKSKLGNYFVIEVNSKIIGIGGLKENEIVKMYIHLESQNKGFGTSILKRLEKEAKKKKITKLCLYTYPKALNFYIKNGFKIIKKFDREMDSIYMGKDIK